MRYEYRVRIFSVQELKEEGIVVDPHKNIIYACTPTGGCEVQDVSVEQTERLAGILNQMGRDGWELVQLFFHKSGIVSFWKRCQEDV